LTIHISIQIASLTIGAKTVGITYLDSVHQTAFTVAKLYYFASNIAGKLTQISKFFMQSQCFQVASKQV